MLSFVILLRQFLLVLQVQTCSVVPWQGLTKAWICRRCHRHMLDRACNSNRLAMVGNSTFNVRHALFYLFIFVVGMSMMMSSRPGGMDSYSSWPNNDGQIMQHNPNMSNTPSKYIRASVYSKRQCDCNVLF